MYEVFKNFAKEDLEAIIKTGHLTKQKLKKMTTVCSSTEETSRRSRGFDINNVSYKTIDDLKKLYEALHGGHYGEIDDETADKFEEGTIKRQVIIAKDFRRI